MLPIYVLKGKSYVNLNGNMYAIVWNICGKNGIGTIDPAKKSINVIIMLTSPVSSNVKNVDIWTKFTTSQIIINPRNIVIKNNIKDNGLAGAPRLYGYGSMNIDISNVGENLRSILDILLANAFANQK